jgi:hypothetical protein
MMSGDRPRRDSVLQDAFGDDAAAAFGDADVPIPACFGGDGTSADDTAAASGADQTSTKAGTPTLSNAVPRNVSVEHEHANEAAKGKGSMGIIARLSELPLSQTTIDRLRAVCTLTLSARDIPVDLNAAVAVATVPKDATSSSESENGLLPLCLSPAILERLQANDAVALVLGSQSVATRTAASVETDMDKGDGCQSVCGADAPNARRHDFLEYVCASLIQARWRGRKVRTRGKTGAL